MSNAAKAAALLDGVRALQPSAVAPTNPLGLKFFEELGAPLTLEQAKVAHIWRVLTECGWHVVNTAKVLAINRVTMHRWIRDYDLKPGETPAILERRKP